MASTCAGCAGYSAPAVNWLKAHPDAMMVQKSRPIHMSGSRVIVTVLGEHTTQSMVLPGITSQDFSQALRQSIEHSGLFAQAKQDGQAPYELQASIAKVDQQKFASETDVSMEVSYILSRMQTKEIVWEKLVVSTYTVPLYGASGSASHPLLATEGAARANIEQAIQEISQLQLE